MIDGPTVIFATNRFRAGWLISYSDQPLFLQIANGHWGPASAATWFPTPSSAEAYLPDFEHRVPVPLAVVCIAIERKRFP